jgi:hypothetical protein
LRRDTRSARCRLRPRGDYGDRGSDRAGTFAAMVNALTSQAPRDMSSPEKETFKDVQARREGGRVVPRYGHPMTGWTSAGNA